MRISSKAPFAALLCGIAVQAAVITISNPDSNYLASTTRIDFSGLTDEDLVSSLSGSGLTLTFSQSAMKLSVPETWGTWSDPPFSEDSTPEVLYSNLFSSLTITFSSPVFGFGFEAQPNLSSTELLTASFFESGGGLLTMVARDVSGNAGALLFAVAADVPISSVQFVNTMGNDFGIANLRFTDTPIPEPATGVLVLAAFVTVGLLRWRRIRRLRLVR